MNNARRKRIQEIIAQMDGISAAIEEIKDEEQAYFDNMPESFQNGDKGSKSQEAIDALEEIDIDNIISSLETAAQ